MTSQQEIMLDVLSIGGMAGFIIGIFCGFILRSRKCVGPWNHRLTNWYHVKHTVLDQDIYERHCADCMHTETKRY